MLEQNDRVTSAYSLDDTAPIQIKAPAHRRNRVDLLCLIGAAFLTLGTGVVLVLPKPIPDRGNSVLEQAPTLPLIPVEIESVPTSQPEIAPVISEPTQMLNFDVEAGLELLGNPLIAATTRPMLITRNIYEPFTLIPERPRDEVIQYTAVAGDTIAGIAARFGLQRESIAWSNPRSYIQILQPGNVLNILPVDGLIHQVLVSQTISSVAEQYNVDPYAVIDSEYNNLFGALPDTVLPSGTQLVVEGGTGEEIAWSPQVIRVAASGGSGGASSGGQISFSPGDPGSCGLVDNPGGGAGWVRPISGYTWIRGFASWHPAADLAASEGTPVSAANSGRVIFAGWNSFGYGYAVVLAHGPFTTIYAHLSSVNVGCGQDVSAGQVIGGSGNTGNSSGPHLHFEVRYNDIPQDPTYSIAL